MMIRVLIAVLLMLLVSVSPAMASLTYDSQTVEPDGTIPYCFLSGNAGAFFSAMNTWEAGGKYNFVQQCYGDTMYVDTDYTEYYWYGELMPSGNVLYLYPNSQFRYNDYCLYLHELGHAQKLDHNDSSVSVMTTSILNNPCYITGADWYTYYNLT